MIRKLLKKTNAGDDYFYKINQLLITSTMSVLNMIKNILKKINDDDDYFYIYLIVMAVSAMGVIYGLKP